MRLLSGLLFCSLLIFTSCIVDEDETSSPPVEVEGLKPVYVQSNEWQSISSSAPIDISRLGKIYYKDQTIFVNESNYGIHVIDNTDPSNPVPTHFIQIPGCNDVAIKGNYLYADNVTDLVVLDISDLDNPVEVNRIKDIRPALNQKYPETFQGSFECVDESKGIVIGWETAVLVDPKCWR